MRKTPHNYLYKLIIRLEFHKTTEIPQKHTELIKFISRKNVQNFNYL